MAANNASVTGKAVMTENRIFFMLHSRIVDLHKMAVPLNQKRKRLTYTYFIKINNWVVRGQFK